MKKVLFVLAMVAVFGFATSTVSAKVITLNNAEVVLIAADENSNVTAPEVKEAKKEKATAKETKAKESSKAKSEGSSEKKESGCSSSCAGK